MPDFSSQREEKTSIQPTRDEPSDGPRETPDTAGGLRDMVSSFLDFCADPSIASRSLLLRVEGGKPTQSNQRGFCRRLEESVDGLFALTLRRLGLCLGSILVFRCALFKSLCVRLLDL